MPFTVPNFNLSYSVWHDPNTPPAAPDSSGMANLAYGRRVAWLGGAEQAGPQVIMSLLLPPGEDVRSEINATNADVIEVPAGTGRFYRILFVDDVGKGFPNEHRVAGLLQTGLFGPWPTPIP